MKSATLAIGATGIDKRKVQFDEATTVDELVQQAKESDDVILRWANRGRRIELQERSGARDWLKENQSLSEEDQITKLTEMVNNYDPTIVKERKAPARKPKQVTLPKGKKSFSPDELAALLQAQGVQVTTDAPE